MRYVSIDILRTAAIVLMVLVHFMENLAGADWAPAGMGAPLFTFLVGVSYRVWLNAQHAKGRSEAEISKVTVRRGLFLFGLGFAFNVFVWLPEDVYNWDVLTFIGVALLVLNVARNLPLPVSVVGCGVAYTLAPALRLAADYPAYWESGHFECDPTVPDVINGFFATGYFPVFPWIVFPLAGYVTATRLCDPASPRPSILGTVFLGLAFVAVPAVCRVIRFVEPDIDTAFLPMGWTMFPPTMEYVAGTLGLALVLFALGRHWIDANPAIASRKSLLAVTTTFSKHSLSIYLLHHVAHIWPMWVCGAATGNEATHFWRQALPVNVAIALAIAFLGAAYFLFRWMDRTDRHGIEAWMRHLCESDRRG